MKSLFRSGAALLGVSAVFVTSAFVALPVATAAEDAGFTVRVTAVDADGAASSLDRTVTGTWSCVLGDAPALTGKWSATAAKEARVSEAPEGASCTISVDPDAQPPAAAAPGSVWAQPTIETPTQTVSAKAAEPVVFAVRAPMVKNAVAEPVPTDQTKEPAAEPAAPLNLTFKVNVVDLQGNPAPLWGKYDFNWSCTAPDGQSLPLTANQPVSVPPNGTATPDARDNAPVGSTCSVGEPSPLFRENRTASFLSSTLSVEGGPYTKELTPINEFQFVEFTIRAPMTVTLQVVLGPQIVSQNGAVPGLKLVADGGGKATVGQPMGFTLRFDPALASSQLPVEPRISLANLGTSATLVPGSLTTNLGTAQVQSFPNSTSQMIVWKAGVLPGTVVPELRFQVQIDPTALGKTFDLRYTSFPGECFVSVMYQVTTPIAARRGSDLNWCRSSFTVSAPDPVVPAVAVSSGDELAATGSNGLGLAGLGALLLLSGTAAVAYGSRTMRSSGR